ncbi:MAG: patatin-like phospholipase family protein [Haliscomenobacter sp.]|nr:patatin-like phospholipase family protein [Haliscomenobacter sp.]
MKEPNEKRIKIRLGICMAGAVSAGAYTAGVMDYLLEALERWQLAKNKAQDGELNGYSIPMHDVEIVILVSASAGGMTAAITARALAEKIEHVNSKSLTEDKTHLPQIGSNNLLYSSWVKLTDHDMLSQLLSTSDLKDKNSTLESLFNSEFIDTLAFTILDQKKVAEPHARPYISDQLDLVLTLSNFEGVQVSYPFRSTVNSRKTYFQATVHQDFAHFVVGEKDPDDGRIHLDFSTGKNTKILSAAAKATGAFPLGFKARKVTRPIDVLAKNKFLKRRWGQLPKLFESTSGCYTTVNTDGGVLNNEPFDLVEEILNEQNSENKNEWNVLLMVDPFPNNESVPVKEKKEDLWSAIPKLIGAMLHQGRAKPRDLNLEDTDRPRFLRFMMAPSRKIDDYCDIQGSKAIACGALSGFSGFFRERFRQHDFILGRKNCQSFLRKYFVLAPEGAHNKGGLTTMARLFDLLQASDSSSPSDVKPIPIIPDLTEEGKPMTESEDPLEFPHFALNDLKAYRKAFFKRLIKVGKRSLNLSPGKKAFFLFLILLTAPLGPLLLILGYLYAKNSIWKRLKKTIQKDFNEWGLLKKE